MATIEQFENAGILISDVLAGNAALEWINENTTLTIDLNDFNSINNMPNAAKLFVVKYTEISTVNASVASESIEGLSQSFKSGNSNNMIWDIAESLLGQYLKSKVKFTPVNSRWK